MSDSVRTLLEEVAGEFVVTDHELDRTIGRAHRRQRRQRVVAGVTAFVVASAGIGAAVWAFSSRQSGRPAGLHANGAIVFVRLNARDPLTGGDLFRVNPDGSDLRRITRGAGAGVSLAISPDGSTVAFAQSPGPTTSAIFVVGVDGTGLRQLSHPIAAPGSLPGIAIDEWPSWTPDGERVRFYRNTGRAPGKGLWEVNADGSGEHLVNPGWIPWYPAWSPDGSRVAWVGDRGTGTGREDLFVADPDGTHRVRLTSDSGLVEMAAWSPDGRRIAFVNDQVIETIAPDGIDRRPVFQCSAPCKEVRWPTWSPDGTEIAFTEFVAGPEAHGSIPEAVSRLVMMRDDGSDIRTVASRFEACCPAWQPVTVAGPTPNLPGPSPSPVVVPPGCANGWESVPIPSPGNFGARLRSVSAVSSNDVWAVGSYQTVPAGYSPPPPGVHGGVPPATWHPLAEHWDGARWQVVSAPNPGVSPDGVFGGSWFVDVAAVSATDAWAVGGSGSSESGLIEHWDGVEWKDVPSPTVNLVDGELMAVSALSPSDAWAAGYGGGEILESVIEHWDGAEWAIVPAPHVGPHDNVLSDVWARSPTDAWAVGQVWDRALILHWDGGAWYEVSSNPDVPFLRLGAISGDGPDDVWAVGATYSDVDGRGPVHGFIVHWDGSSWHQVAAPGLESQSALKSVVALGPGDVWAAGAAGDGFDQQLILHWDGSEWGRMSGPSFGTAAVSVDLGATSDGLWLAGTISDQSRERTVAARSC